MHCLPEPREDTPGANPKKLTLEPTELCRVEGPHIHAPQAAESVLSQNVPPDSIYHPVALAGCLHLFHSPVPALFSLVNCWAPFLAPQASQPPWSLRLPSLLCTCTCVSKSTCLSTLPRSSIHGPQEPTQHWAHDKLTVNDLGRQSDVLCILA